MYYCWEKTPSYLTSILILNYKSILQWCILSNKLDKHYVYTNLRWKKMNSLVLKFFWNILHGLVSIKLYVTCSFLSFPWDLFTCKDVWTLKPFSQFMFKGFIQWFLSCLGRNWDDKSLPHIQILCIWKFPTFPYISII